MAHSIVRAREARVQMQVAIAKLKAIIHIIHTLTTEGNEHVDMLISILMC
jgi:hypothetical protein